MKLKSAQRRNLGLLRRDGSRMDRSANLITEGRAPDEVYAEVRKEFGEEDLVNLSLAIITINGWNRLAIGFRKIPGEYQPHKIG
jgi:hypothetical protein